MTMAMGARAASLRFRALGIDTYPEFSVYMNVDCDVCRAEGFAARTRVTVSHGDRSIIATLNVVHGNLLALDEASLSVAAQQALGVRNGNTLGFAHVPVIDSFGSLRAKLYGHRLGRAQFDAIIGDVVAGRYSDLHLAAFVAAGAGDRLDLDETVALTAAMTAAGERLRWSRALVVDKHSVGGLPGNRTTPLVVAIVTATGLLMPKTSSRAITSPAGTADTMEVLAPVDLSLEQIRRVVDRTGGCIAWGGAVRLSPADDVLIRIERPLDLDSDGQLVASVLSKKLAAGSSHVVIDMPVGPTAKLRDAAAAQRLAERLTRVGSALGLDVDVVRTDGSQPVGRGIGPALEAQDVLRVLRGAPDAPTDLAERAVLLAGHILERAAAAPSGEGATRARTLLTSGAALRQFEAICEAQGGMREPPRARERHDIAATDAGRVARIDNRVLARIAKLAGAPADKVAGLQLHVRLGDAVERGQPLYTVHAASPGALTYALDYAGQHRDVIAVEAT